MTNLLRRLRAASKRAWSEGPLQTVGSRSLDEMSDEELEEELMRRRRARAARKKGTPARDAISLETMREKQIAQHYASLNLRPGSDAEEIKRAYRRLVRRIHPDRHMTDAQQHQTATELTETLTRAYEALLHHLGDRTPTRP